MNINKINLHPSGNISKVKNILILKKKKINISYKTLDSDDIDNINLKYKNKLINKLSERINDNLLLKDISIILNDYNINIKLPKPEKIEDCTNLVRCVGKFHKIHYV
jgi:hypothetical protein